MSISALNLCCATAGDFQPASRGTSVRRRGWHHNREPVRGLWNFVSIKVIWVRSAIFVFLNYWSYSTKYALFTRRCALFVPVDALQRLQAIRQRSARLGSMVQRLDHLAAHLKRGPHFIFSYSRQSRVLFGMAGLAKKLRQHLDRTNRRWIFSEIRSQSVASRISAGARLAAGAARTPAFLCICPIGGNLFFRSH